jgi:type I restriction enzyme S subunit
MSDQWMATTLGEIAEIVGGGTPSTKELKYWGGDIVWLTPTEVVRAPCWSLHEQALGL